MYYVSFLLLDIEEVIKEKNISKLKAIISANPNAVYMRDLYEETLLMKAVKRNSPSAFQLLLSCQLNVWTADKLGENVYHKCCKHGRDECLRILCEYDATFLNCGDNDNYTPLHLASMFGEADCVKVLLTYDNVNVNVKDGANYTPLHWAAMYGEVNCINVIIAHDDVDVNVKDDWNRTPLEWAVINHHDSCMNLLLTHRN